MKKIFSIFLGIVIILVIGVTVKGNDRPKPAVATMGMVSSAHPVATKAGLEILEAGGNAFDAAVAIASTLNVVEPMMSGVGGYGTILIYDAGKNQIRFLDSSGKIPVNTNPDAFRKPTANYKENRRGPKAVSTPGNVNAWAAMSKTYGVLNWRWLFKRAIKTAEDGFLLDWRTAGSIGYAFDDFPAHAKKIYGKEGKPLKLGEKLVQRDLAKSLSLIAAEGPKVFYGGELGKKIDAEMKKTGGFLSLADLQADKAEWWLPISINYRGYKVYTASPPSTAFPSLIRLGLMSRFDLEKLGHNSLGMLHRYIEVTKHAFWCRLCYAGDPEISPPPLDMLLSETYWKTRIELLNLKRAIPFSYDGLPSKEKKNMSHTTHFVAADAQGNIVCATQTLGNSFGSRIMPEGTGIWLNNSLAYCTFEPAGNPMDAHPGRRKLSGDCPTIIVKNGKPWAALGTPGGHTIGQTVPQMVMGLIDFGMSMAEALAAPRVSFIEPDRIYVEAGVSKKVIGELKVMGHNIREMDASGGLTNAHGLTVEYGKDGTPIGFTGASDPRGVGLAKGLDAKEIKKSP
ncbi:MAG: gamma-glutamyltransferase [bacterium]|nr:gamma-glutamyltransferase [bacterium]